MAFAAFPLILVNVQALGLVLQMSKRKSETEVEGDVGKNNEQMLDKATIASTTADCKESIKDGRDNDVVRVLDCEERSQERLQASNRDSSGEESETQTIANLKASGQDWPMKRLGKCRLESCSGNAFLICATCPTEWDVNDNGTGMAEIPDEWRMVCDDHAYQVLARLCSVASCVWQLECDEDCPSHCHEKHAQCIDCAFLDNGWRSPMKQQRCGGDSIARVRVL